MGERSRHVDFDGDVEMRRGDDALRQPLGDDLPHLAHRLRLFGDGALDVGDVDALAAVVGAKRNEIEALLRRQLLGGRADAQARVVLRLEIGLHVLLDDAAFGTAAVDGVRVDHALLGQRRRARADAEARGRAAGTARRSAARGRRCGDGAAARGADAARLSRRAARSAARGRAGAGVAGNGLAGLAEIADDALHRDADPDADHDLEQRAVLKLSTSMTDLSVSTVNRMSPLATLSPSFFSHSTMALSSVI